MNKRMLPMIMIAMLVLVSLVVTPSRTDAKTFDLDAKSAILVDAGSGKVLFAKEPDLVLPPASMTKMMTEYLVWEAVESGKISWDSTTEISDYAYFLSKNTEFSGVGLTQNKEYTVRELYEAMAINSDNATTVALAELIAGSEEEFVQLMNEKGKEMGLTDFEFVNATGLDNGTLDGHHPKGTGADATNLMSARSTALLAYNLIKDYPESLEISSIPVTDFDGQEIRNWNWMLKHDTDSLNQFYYEGIDGLKTGFTELAGDNFTGTAIRDSQRFITVVMGTPSRESRFEETAKLLDYGFDYFSNETLFAEGYQLDGKSTIPVAKGKEESVDVAMGQAYSMLIKEEDKKNYSVKYHINKKLLNEDGELTAPIKKGEKVGTVEVVYNGEDQGYVFETDDKGVDLVTTESVEKKNWFMLTISVIGNFFSGIFSSVLDMIKGLFN